MPTTDTGRILARVEFNSGTEFLEEVKELARRPGLNVILDNEVRTCISHEGYQDKPVSRVYCVATAVKKSDNGHLLLLELKRYIGDDWGKDIPASRETLERADEYIGQLEVKLQTGGLLIRHGRVRIV